MASPTKVGTAIDEWASIALGAIRVGAVDNIAADYDSMLYIVCALAGTTAHLGTRIIVQVSSNASGDEDWRDLSGGSFTACIGTAFKSDFADTEEAAQTVLSVTDPATGKLDHLFKWIFLEHTTPANCEIAFLVAQSGDAGDTITVQDGITNQHTAAASDVWTVDGAAPASAVSTFTVLLPTSALRYRILYINDGATGSTVYTSARIVEITALS